jgi:uncharacterized protein
VPRDIFVDSGAWIAIAVTGDQHHDAGAEMYRRLVAAPSLLITTNLVIAEAYENIRRHGGSVRALRYLESIRSSDRVLRVYSNADLEAQAEQALIRFADQDFSFVDAVSFAVMREFGITEAFAFDHHFLIAGFSLVPH